METLKRIDFDSETPLYSQSDFQDKILNHSIDGYINLNEIELANVISVISLMQINSGYILEKKDEAALLEYIINGQNDFFNDNRIYIVKLINELDQCYIDDFKDLLKDSYLKSELFHNDNLNYFCSEAILDTILLERLSEFGLFNVHKMCNKVFKDINNEVRNEWADQRIRRNDVAKAIVDVLMKTETKLNEREIQSMVMMFKYEFYGNSYGIKSALLEGHHAFSNNWQYMQMSARINAEIKPIVQSIIVNERDNNLNRDQGWTR